MEKDGGTSDNSLSFHKDIIIENVGPDTSIEDLTKCFSPALNQCSFQTRPKIKMATDRKGRQLGYASVTVPITKVDAFLNYDLCYLNKQQLRVSLMDSRNTRTTWHTTQTGVFTTTKSWVSPDTASNRILNCTLIDGGVFLTHPKIKTPEDVITKAAACGVEKLVTLGTSVYHSREGLKLSRLFSGTLHCTAGVSPRGAVFWTDESVAQLEEVLEAAQCLAVGPCGFDLSTDNLLATCDQQLIAFEQQLQLAIRLGKPVIVTENKATSEVISMLTKYKPQLTRVAVMSWPEEPEAFTSYLKEGFYYFISGEINDTQPPSPLMRCLRSSFEPAWVDQLLLASKYPHRTPLDRPTYRKRDTGPDRLTSVVETLAELLEHKEEVLATKMRRQAEQFYWGRCEKEDQDGQEEVSNIGAGEKGIETDFTGADDSLTNEQSSTDWTYRIVLWLAFISGLMAIYFYDFRGDW